MNDPGGICAQEDGRHQAVCGPSRAKQTGKDAYPLLPDKVQGQLAGLNVFSTLDIQCGYWQLSVRPAGCYKTAFSPGPCTAWVYFNFAECHLGFLELLHPSSS